MPATPTYNQARELRNLYAITKPNGPDVDDWFRQINDQGQWTMSAIEVLLTQLRDRRDGLVESQVLNAMGGSPLVQTAPVAEGWVVGHHLIDGTVWHVHPLRNASRRDRYPDAREVHSLDLERLTASGRARWRARGRAYTQAQQERLSYRFPTFNVGTLMTPERVAEFGVTHGFCGICGRHLTVTVSVERGVGPVCWRRVIEYRDRIAAAIAPDPAAAFTRLGRATADAAAAADAYSSALTYRIDLR
jgi:hypothetical protein